MLLDYIDKTVNKLIRKYKTRNPYEICDALGIHVRLLDLGVNCKAYYLPVSRIRNIVLSTRVSEPLRRVLVAHELGHDRLHYEIALLQGFHEMEMFDFIKPTEFQANMFAAELLLDDTELFDLFNDSDSSFFGIARELDVPAALLDFKFRMLKHKGYRISPPYIVNSDFLKNEIDDYSDDEDV